MGQALPLLLVASLAAAARADPPRAYRFARGGAEPGISLSIGYTFGTHQTRATRASGEVILDPAAPQEMSGVLRVRIDDLHSDSGTRDCHMREAMGLDYARSPFPREHVCDGDAIPAGAVAFPEVVLEIHGAAAPPIALLREGQQTPIALQAVWTIHGLTRPALLRLTASRDPAAADAVRVRGTAQLKLRDFGVVVKSAQVLFLESSVDDTATVHLDAVLAPAPPPR